MKKLFKKYNQRNSMMLISLYPNKDEMYSAGVTGVASYAKNTVTKMSKQTVVLAQDNNSQEKVYEEDNTLVIRSFKPNTYTLWLNLLINIFRFSDIKKILIQFDFGMYGNMLSTALIIPFLGILKILGYETYIVNHHVVTDVKKLSGHVGLGTGVKDLIKAQIYNSIFHVFYRLLGITSNKIIVLEDPLKDRLSHYIPSSKIITIPHAVDSSLSAVDKSQARKDLGIKENEYIVMFFGFVNWFKGADFFVHAFQDTNKILNRKARFIIAGGESVTLKDRGYYKKFYNRVQHSIETSKNVSITGYVPQEDIAKYFSAADLVVFPYREFMCASGVLSLVFSYQKPFILSERLAPMLDTLEFKKALKESGLTKKDFIFNLNKQSCIKRTSKVLENGLKTKMVHLAQIMREQRAFGNNAAIYEELMFAPARSSLFAPLKSRMSVLE